MNLGFSLQHNVNVSQQLNLAPQLLQWLKILQVPTTDLSEIVTNELETNPALEIEVNTISKEDLPPTAAEENEIGEQLIDDKLKALAEMDSDWGDDSYGCSGTHGSSGQQNEQERYDYTFDSIAAPESLDQHLLTQLSIANISESNRDLAELIIGSLDGRGYFPLSIDECAEMTHATPEQVEATLSTIQEMDPQGIGARDLRECLTLQAKEMDDDSTIRIIINEYLDALGRKQYADIAIAIGTTEEDVLDALEFIKSLKPAPAESFKTERTHYIDADVTLKECNNKYSIELNDKRIPRLCLSASCKNLLKKKSISPDELSYIRSKLRSASFLIQGITQRQDTLRKVTEQILNSQYEYISQKDGKLKPLTMARIASIIGVHETTISRAIANKYIRTPSGIFEMRHFFCTGYRCADGSLLTPDVVKELIEKIIDTENPAKPFRDVDIAATLKKQGLSLARRTVAKYRDEIGIPTSKERKQSELRVSKKKTLKPKTTVNGEISIFHTSKNQQEIAVA